MSDKILKAGAIILSSKNKDSIALLYRRKENDWSFPKGHIEQEEDANQAMAREIKEETGLNVRIIKELPNYFYTSPREGMISVKMFLTVSADDSKLKTEFENDSIQWISYNEVVNKLTYNNLKDYFNSVLPIIKM